MNYWCKLKWRVERDYEYNIKKILLTKTGKKGFKEVYEIIKKVVIKINYWEN